MNIRYVRWLGASVLGLALASIPQIALCQQEDELVAAIEAAFPDEQPPAAISNADDRSAKLEPATASSSDGATPGQASTSSEPASAATAEVTADNAAATASQSADGPGAEVAAEADFEQALPAAATPNKPTPPRSARELSVAPTSNPYYPENIPAWIREPANYTSDRHVIPVGSIPTADKVEADDWLDEQLMASLYAYIDEQLLEPGAATRMQDRLTADYIRTNLIDDPLGYTVQLQTSSGPLYQKWVQVVVSSEQRQQLREWHREAIQRERIVPLGLGVAGVLTIIGGFHLLVRRTAKSANETRAAPAARRVELPVVKPRATKKACCGKMLPVLLLAIPIVVVVSVSKRAREAREEAASESIVIQSTEVVPTTNVVTRDEVRKIVIHSDRRDRRNEPTR